MFRLNDYNNYYIIDFKKYIRKFSSAPFNGGIGYARRYINRTVSINYNYDPLIEINDFLEKNNIERKGTVVTITAVPVSRRIMDTKKVKDYTIQTIITAGFDNALSIGNRNNFYGTINIAVIINMPLSDAAIINLMQSITEAKAQAMNDLNIIDKSTGLRSPGTSTDTVSIFIDNYGKSILYAGRLTEPGYHASVMVYKSIVKIYENNKIVGH